MPEPNLIAFSHREVVEALLKKQGIHKGIWGLYIKFGIQGANVGPSDSDVKPAAIVPVLEIGLQKFAKLTTISVDAAAVIPTAKAPSHRTQQPSSKRATKRV